MNDKHTPGPWHWDSDPVKGDPTGRVRYRVTTIGKTITQVYYSSFEGGPTNAEYDARLIAAAPDLLEALKEAIEVIRKIKPLEYGIGTIVRGEAAIRKATGEL